MPSRKTSLREQVQYHKEGGLWGKGRLIDGVMTGYWEWFRKDGTRVRSGSFDAQGRQVGEWTTYDKSGKASKVTLIKPKAKS